MNLWIKHPNSQKYSATLTFSVYALVICLFKFLMNGVVIEVIEKRTINFGTVDATLIAAVLTPTLISYVSKKFAPQYTQTTTEEETK